MDPELAEEEEWNRAGNAQAQPSQRQRQDQAKRTRDLAEKEHRVAKTLMDQPMPVMTGSENPEPGAPNLGKRHDRPEVPKTMLDHSFFDAHFQNSYKRDERVAEPLVVGKIVTPVFTDETLTDNKSVKKQSSMNILTISGVLLLLACMLAICFLPKTAPTAATKPASSEHSTSSPSSSSSSTLPTTGSTTTTSTSTKNEAGNSPASSSTSSVVTPAASQPTPQPTAPVENAPPAVTPASH